METSRCFTEEVNLVCACKVRYGPFVVVMSSFNSIFVPKKFGIFRHLRVGFNSVGSFSERYF